MNVYEKIHEICFVSNGAYQWPFLYNSPIHLRNWIYNKLKQHFENINNSNNKEVTAENIDKIHKPNIPQNNTYTLKGPK